MVGTIRGSVHANAITIIKAPVPLYSTLPIVRRKEKGHSNRGRKSNISKRRGSRSFRNGEDEHAESAKRRRMHEKKGARG